MRANFFDRDASTRLRVSIGHEAFQRVAALLVCIVFFVTRALTASFFMPRASFFILFRHVEAFAGFRRRDALELLEVLLPLRAGGVVLDEFFGDREGVAMRGARRLGVSLRAGEIANAAVALDQIVSPVEALGGAFAERLHDLERGEVSAFALFDEVGVEERVAVQLVGDREVVSPV